MRVSLKTPLVLVDDGDLVRTSRENPGYPLSPDVVVEVCSGSNEFAGVVAKIERYVARGSRYAVAIDRATGRVVSRGIAPEVSSSTSRRSSTHSAERIGLLREDAAPGCE